MAKTRSQSALMLAPPRREDAPLEQLGGALVKVAEAEAEEAGAKTARKRLNVDIKASIYDEMKAILASHGLELADTTRVALGVLTSAVPHLAEGGHLALIGQDGTNYRFNLPLQFKPEPRHAPEAPPPDQDLSGVWQ